MDELVEIQDEIYNLIQKLEKDKNEQEEIDIEEPLKTVGTNFEEINKLKNQLSDLRDEYIQSRGDVTIRNKMEKIEEQISKLGKQQKPVKVGKSVKINKVIKEPEIEKIEIIKHIVKMIGKGFKKGSPEAKAHAEIMRLARETKKQPTPIVSEKKTNKARVQKGSEEAKALARKLVEARKAKQEKKKKELEEEKRLELLKNPVKSKGRPWYYIGDIPKGYREATETEAISHNKVSKFGKYKVDNDKYFLWH